MTSTEKTDPQSGAIPLPLGGDRGRLRTIIAGGGATGFFLAINLKEMVPEMDVTIFEKGNNVLRKVKVSGGGRCNLTNTFQGVGDLSAVYPRGHRLLKRLFKGFDNHDAMNWFEQHGVRLTTQADHRVFPASQDSQTIIDCFLKEARRHHISIQTGQSVSSLSQLSGFDFIAVTTGGSPHRAGLAWLEDLGHEVVPPVPSLFTFNIADSQLRNLMGTTIDNVTAFIPGHNFRSTGSLLITHWGLSGPAILRLSSHEARTLSESDYRLPLCVNWSGRQEDGVKAEMGGIARSNPQKLLASYRPFNIPQRLWDYLLCKTFGNAAHRTWASLNKKETNRIVNALCCDNLTINGKGSYKEEFVTCGGIALTSVNPSTLESRTTPNLYFAGEVLDIDGITGGFNFQSAWTTAHTVARAIANKARPQRQ